MPSTRTVLNVFISFPSQQKLEKLTVEKTLLGMNEELIAAHEVQLQPVDWENTVVPGVGIDAQEVISKQIDYDLYIGLMGSVFGTPTKRAKSGTEEEFDQALLRFQTSPKSVRLLFYFRTTSPNVFHIDLKQLEAVKAFRTKLENSGVLYKDYEELDDLTAWVTKHVRKLISDHWTKDGWRVQDFSPSVLSSRQEPIEVAEQATCPPVTSARPLHGRPGLQEVTVEVMNVAREMSKHYERLNPYSSSIATALEDLNDEVDAAILRNNEEAKLIAYDDLASKLAAKASDLRTEVVVFGSLSARLSDSVIQLASLFFEENAGRREDLTATIDAYEKSLDSLRLVRSSLGRHRLIMERLGSFTKALRKARDSYGSAVDELVSSYTVFLTQSEIVIRHIRRELSELSQVIVAGGGGGSAG